MDPNQTIRTTPSGLTNSRAETVPSGPAGTDGTTGTAQTQRIPPIGTSNQDRFSPLDHTSVPDQTSIPDRTKARIRQEVTVSSIIDKTHSQKAAYRTIENQLDQAERELAEHRPNAQERNQPQFDPLRETLNPQITGAFSTPEILSARSGRYMGENSQQPLQQGMPQRSLSYSGLDKI
ncbi:hypothetical protein F2Q69_00006250 [Brassica cretica]|uniref:Uncharacterized protein n=1 Tax=Brassica cretica TaxID=69181 RepID=A0A8S9NLQ7_BRACR|nr:hypothetical protein F2Q69_00006250 [Brassica cretica]